MPPLNQTFKALSDPSRRKILRLLSREDLTAGDIADHFSISKPSISHHLSILKQAGLISAERQGQNIYYSLGTTVFQELVAWLLDYVPASNYEKKEDPEDTGFKEDDEHEQE
ncbi:MAG TPA: winged helix-turn-helix transcriptional regulator [Firmicutes bacterium]|nr:winged helix-turn-helix transcriptional regulator [Bacillota bacterium]